MLPNAGIKVVIPGRSQQNILRVQDKMVLNIVDSNKWRRPVYFANTVSEDNFMGLDPYLQMQGLVYRVRQNPVNAADKMDISKAIYMLDKVYRFGPGKVTESPTDEAARGLQANYTACYIEVALGLRKPLMDRKTEIETLQKLIATGGKAAEGKKAELLDKQKRYQDTLELVIGQLKKCSRIIPDDWRPRALLGEFLINHNRVAEAELAAREALKTNPNNSEYLKMFIQALEMQGKASEAIVALKGVIANDPDYWDGYVSLARNYMQMRRADSAIAMIDMYASAHPGDRRAEQMRSELMSMVTTAQPQQPAKK
jgi:tetratricopeptide (TPR) repeat protein